MWLIETIRRAGQISYRDLSDKWERRKDLSDCKPLHRVTFHRWIRAIKEQLKIEIECQKTGEYLYYIANPEDIDEDKLKKWMLDTFAVGDLIAENISLKDRILVDPIPSGHDYLPTLIEAMKENRVLNIEYRKFGYDFPGNYNVEPYCLKLHENRWYLIGNNPNNKKIGIYGLDRMVSVEITDEKFKLPKGFCPSDYLSNYIGVVLDNKVKPERIVIRANAEHAHYLKTLPLHHSQRLIKDYGDYADFELYLSPTYDFVMKLLYVGAMVEVIKPASLRKTMKGWINDMYELYEND